MYQELWRIRSAGLGHKVYYPRSVRRRSRFYVVKAGHIPGLYYDYHDAQEQISGFSCAVWKSFKSLTEALAYQQQSDPDMLDDPRPSMMSSLMVPFPVTPTEQAGR